MMRERMTAVRACVSDIVDGKYADDTGPHVVSPHGVELRRVVLLGFVVNKYTGDGNFASITIDDGTETIRAKAWGTEAALLEETPEEKLVLVVGKIREYEDETYVVPEIIEEVEDSNLMTLHLLERYQALLTRTGLSTLETPPEEISETQSRQEETLSTENTLTSYAHEEDTAVTLSEQILQFIQNRAGQEGVKLNEVVEHFTAKGEKKSDITLKVIDLQDTQRIREVEIGRYVSV
ncbi:MAG: OB-fold nucleic acid binding domain-containing protein [Candidatus Thorarchaeota archaeon]